jgi:Ca2+-binding RTX toxin-like protein
VPFSLDIGSTERLEVNGQGGNDTITGASGLAGKIKLDLDGGAGHDLVTGGDGADEIAGGWGNDVLTGAAGADVFVFNRGEDVITDFQNGIDRIKLAVAGVDDFGDLAGRISADGDDVVIDFGHDELTLADTAIHEVNAADFLFG